jgi:pectin methylesterase-like acyl-CoA thioesterase
MFLQNLKTATSRPPQIRAAHARSVLASAAVMVCMTTARADTLHVPADYQTIQGAIDAAMNGDDVVVSNGTYNEAINFLGKAILVASSRGPDLTVIDAAGLDTSVVTCASEEGEASVLRGFTIRGGTGTIRADGYA